MLVKFLYFVDENLVIVVQRVELVADFFRDDPGPDLVELGRDEDRLVDFLADLKALHYDVDVVTYHLYGSLQVIDALVLDQEVREKVGGIL